MMDENDEKEAALVRVREGYAGIEATLGEIQENASSQGSDGSRKGQEAASMSAAVDSLEYSLTGYLQDPDQDYLDLASSSTGDFNEARAAFRRLQLSGEERDQAEELETLFDHTLDESNDVLALDYSVRRNEPEFTDLRAELESVLEEEVEAQRSLQGTRPQETSQVLGRTQTLILLAFAVVLAALAAILFFASGAAARVGQGPARRRRRGEASAAGGHRPRRVVVGGAIHAGGLRVREGRIARRALPIAGRGALEPRVGRGGAYSLPRLPPLRIAVNLSTRQFNQQDLADKLARILDETGLDPSCLELEFIESLLMEDIKLSSAMLDELRTFTGLKLSIDDFGTGYSSLSYLKRFPLDTL